MSRPRLASAAVSFCLVAAATSLAFAQPSTGQLPPAPEQPPGPPAPAPSTAPTTAPSAAPTATTPAPAPAPVQPAPVQPAPAQPAPAYGYPPGYGYPPPPPPPEKKPVRSVSLTFSPIHLILPVFELTGEVRVVDHFGIAGIAGYGSISETTTNLYGSETTDKFTVYELGGQLVFYPLEAFDNLELGAELLYLHVGTDSVSGTRVNAAGEGLAIGPMVGYKLLTSGGFTFVVQGGVEYVALTAHANDTSGNTAQDSEKRWIPLLNLNIGWSL